MECRRGSSGRSAASTCAHLPRHPQALCRSQESHTDALEVRILRQGCKHRLFHESCSRKAVAAVLSIIRQAHLGGWRPCCWEIQEQVDDVPRLQIFLNGSILLTHQLLQAVDLVLHGNDFRRSDIGQTAIIMGRGGLHTCLARLHNWVQCPGEQVISHNTV